MTVRQPAGRHGGNARVDEEGTMPTHQDRPQPVFSRPPVDGTDEELEAWADWFAAELLDQFQSGRDRSGRFDG